MEVGRSLLWRDRTKHWHLNHWSPSSRQDQGSPEIACWWGWSFTLRWFPVFGGGIEKESGPLRKFITLNRVYINLLLTIGKRRKKKKFTYGGKFKWFDFMVRMMIALWKGAWHVDISIQVEMFLFGKCFSKKKNVWPEYWVTTSFSEKISTHWYFTYRLW